MDEVMTNEERWKTFITELREYVGVHHLGAPKHTYLYNQTRYFRKIFRQAHEPSSPEMADRIRLTSNLSDLI